MLKTSTYLQQVTYMILLQLVVGPDVLGQVIASHKLLAALRALEPFFACMCPPMTLQLVGSRKSFPTIHPRTDEGPFPWE